MQGWDHRVWRGVGYLLGGQLSSAVVFARIVPCLRTVCHALVAPSFSWVVPGRL
jgi:hypothetical protein